MVNFNEEKMNYFDDPAGNVIADKESITGILPEFLREINL